MTCNDCICSEVCYYKSFNDVRNLEKRRNDVEKICKSFVHRDSLKNAPTVDAVEVVHSEWTLVIDENDCECIECPLCGEQFYDGDNDTFDKPYNYCPNCGADMRGETE